uniref:Uncharacterized protein n=1 Tax=Arundo donax TaxID=35708 RepID=A0A0A9ADH3_ARUDO
MAPHPIVVACTKSWWLVRSHRSFSSIAPDVARSIDLRFGSDQALLPP